MSLKRPEWLISIARSAIASSAKYSGLTGTLEKLRSLTSHPGIRIVSYHKTESKNILQLENHFRYFARVYQPATWTDFQDHIEGIQKWDHPKQGILIAFDDGGLSNFTVARPLLRKYGLTGIFLIPTDWINTLPQDQPLYALNHRISAAQEGDEKGLAMTWDHIRLLASEGDKIVSHTSSHHRFSETDSAESLEYEISKSKDILENELKIPIDTFSWVGGETSVYQKSALNAAQDSGYRYILSTILGLNDSKTDPLLIRRTALSDDWSLDTVRFWLLPLSDRRYHKKELMVRDQLGLSLKSKSHYGG